jgi:Tfp pilus assembly protein PilW
MITSTIHTKTRRRVASAGFTLTEVLIGASLSTVVLAGVLSAFLMLGRSGVNVSNYAMSEAEIRRGVEEFSQDIRMASNVTWNSSTSVTLTVPNNYTTTANQVTYAYDDSASGGTAQTFYRRPGNTSSTASPLILVRNIASFSYARFNRLDTAATNDTETKRIQISMNVRRTGTTVVAADTKLVMASYILRNKATN